MSWLSIIPVPYRLAMLLALAIACGATGWVKGAGHVQDQWDRAEGTRAAAVASAYQKRIASNKADADRQAATNATITKEKDNEIARLTTRIESLSRLRVGSAICGGPATPAETPSASSSDSADTSGRLVREDVDRDIKALILDVEKDLATGRACQAFVRENRLQP